MAQLVARLDDGLLQEVDRLVAQGAVASRSDAVRSALRRFVEEHRRAAIAASIVEGYTRQPQTRTEMGWADEATVRMIAEEPW